MPPCRPRRLRRAIRNVVPQEGPLRYARSVSDAGVYLTSALRLGNSGLKVSKIILGCLSYGSPGAHFLMHVGLLSLTSFQEYQPWVLGEEEGIKHIKVAYDLGINTFDTANVRIRPRGPLAFGASLTLACRSTATACRKSSSGRPSERITCRETKSWS